MGSEVDKELAKHVPPVPSWFGKACDTAFSFLEREHGFKRSAQTISYSFAVEYRKGALFFGVGCEPGFLPYVSVGGDCAGLFKLLDLANDDFQKDYAKMQQVGQADVESKEYRAAVADTLQTLAHVLREHHQLINGDLSAFRIDH